MAKYTPKYRNTAPRKKHKGLVSALVLVAVLAAAVLASMSWDSSAKYVTGLENEAAIRAHEFYFTSDYLLPEGKTYPLNSSTTSFAFELRNHDDLNQSDLDINYTVTVTSDDDSFVLEYEDTPDTAGKYSLAVGEEARTVTLKYMKPGKTYNIVAVGENGYTQTLRATIEIKEDPTGVYKNTQKYTDYVLLTIWTQNMQATNITFVVPAGLIPDSLDGALEEREAGATITLPSLASGESRKYRFFTTAAYDKTGDFTVMHNGARVPEAELPKS